MLSLSALLGVLGAGLAACGASQAPAPTPAADTLAASPPAGPARLSLFVAGDLMQHDPQIQAALQPDGTYDYSSYFGLLHGEIERADVAIANLEVTLGGRPYRGYPLFSAPDEYLTAIRDAGFDVLLTANNHCCDTGRKGLLRTIALCDSIGMPHLGTYADPAARDTLYPFLLERGGIRLALLSFTYGTNGLPVPEPIVVNRIDTVQILADIERARAMQPDLIIAFPHWGIEYQTQPSASMRRLARWLTAHGVDHVIGSHPHVIQPVEVTTDSLTGRQHLVAWSLGNLVSDQATFPRYGGMVLRLELEKERPDGPTRLAWCGYALTFVARYNWTKRNHAVLPVSRPDSLLTPYLRLKRDQYLRMARPLLDKHCVGIGEYQIQ